LTPSVRPSVDSGYDSAARPRRTGREEFLIRIIRRLAALVSLFWPAAALGQPLVGQWESVERTPGGVGEVIEFRADGTARQVSAAMGDATYELRGDWLLTFWKDRTTGKISILANRVELEGDELLQKDEQGNLVSRMRRAGAPDKDSALAGFWCSEDGPGLTTLTEFTPRGDMFIRLTIREVSGRYWLSGDQLAVELEGSSRKEFQYRVADDVLTVTPPGGTAREFRRARARSLKKSS
jgi:hypothetical protein